MSSDTTSTALRPGIANRRVRALVAIPFVLLAATIGSGFYAGAANAEPDTIAACNQYHPEKSCLL